MQGLLLVGITDGWIDLEIYEKRKEGGKERKEETWWRREWKYVKERVAVDD